MPAGPDAETQRLDALVGQWKSAGRTIPEGSEPVVEIAGTDNYAWLPGGFFLEHRVEVRMGEQRVEVLEIIGPYDPDTGSYPMHSFDSAGHTATMSLSVDDDGVWTILGAEGGSYVRSTLRVAGDRGSMAASWEKSSDGERWLPWMEMGFTKIA